MSEFCGRELKFVFIDSDGEEIDLTDYCSDVSVDEIDASGERKYFDHGESHSVTVRFPDHREELQREYILWWIDNTTSMN